MKLGIEIAFNQISFYKKVIYFFVLFSGALAAQDHPKKTNQFSIDSSYINGVFSSYKSIANYSPDSAINRLNKALELSIKNNYTFGEINALRFSADMHSLISKYDTALQILQRAFTIATNTKDVKNIINIHNLKGNILLDKVLYHLMVFIIRMNMYIKQEVISRTFRIKITISIYPIKRI